MAIIPLIIFVVGSLVLSIWAWRNYETVSRKESVGADDPAAFITFAVIGGSLPELLRHYTRWSLTPRIGLSVATTALALYLASRVLSKVRQKRRTAQRLVTTQASSLS
jgi:hypothetical protein